MHAPRKGCEEIKEAALTTLHQLYTTSVRIHLSGCVYQRRRVGPRSAREVQAINEEQAAATSETRKNLDDQHGIALDTPVAVQGGGIIQTTLTNTT